MNTHTVNVAVILFQSRYKMEGNGEVTLITDGCLECGSCRITAANIPT